MKQYFVLISVFLSWTFVCGSSCPDEWIDCGNDVCVAELWRCDGENDCLNLKDEENCDSGIPPEACKSNEFQCTQDGSCIPFTRHCDGQHDCLDDSDEINCDSGTSYLAFNLSGGCSNATCSQNCRSSRKGPECYCNDGYVLSTRDNKTCLDIDECSEDGFCSQKCTNLPGSYKCSCTEDYELIDNITCKAPGTEPLMIFSTSQEIRGVFVRSKEHFSMRKSIFKIATVDFDPLNAKLYWVETSNTCVIYSSNMNGSPSEDVLHNGLKDPRAIAVDYVARNLYLTDEGLKHILVCKIDGSMCHVLHSSDLERPHDITLDLPEGFLYWSDWGLKASGIYRSGMDGSSRIALVSKNIKWPNGITVDHTTNRLYWTDARKLTIEYVSLYGTNRKTLHIEGMVHPYALAIFEDNLYWSDLKSETLNTCNKFTGRGLSVISNKSAIRVRIFHPILTRTNNPCRNNPCSHMCLISPLSGYSCACPPGFSIGSDDRSCMVDSNFPMLWVNDESKIYHIRTEFVGIMSVDELPVAHIDKIGRLAYDWSLKYLYVTDTQKPAIYAINMTTLVKKELVRNNVVMPEDIALDWINANLYWVDSSKGTVEVVSTESTRTATIIVGLSKPIAIALRPVDGRMFISTIGEDQSVSMYDMDGKNRRTLNGVTGHIVALAVHPTESLLYFADLEQKTLSSVDYSDPKSHPAQVKTVIGSIVSLAVDEEYFYWTDSKYHVLNYCRQTSTSAQIVRLPGLERGFVSSWKVIYAHVPAIQNLGNKSCEANGGCSYLCLSSPGGGSCIGPNGMPLSNETHSRCPAGYSGERCEVQAATEHFNSHNVWVVGVLVGVILVALIAISTLLYRRNRFSRQSPKMETFKDGQFVISGTLPNLYETIEGVQVRIEESSLDKETH